MTLIQVPDPDYFHSFIIGDLDDPGTKIFVWDKARERATALLICNHLEEFKRLELEQVKKVIDEFSVKESS